MSQYNKHRAGGGLRYAIMGKKGFVMLGKGMRVFYDIKEVIAALKAKEQIVFLPRLGLDSDHMALVRSKKRVSQ